MDAKTITTISFRENLNKKETVFFRGAILKKLGERADESCHNHIGEGVKYAYPLVQYKSIRGKAAVVAFGDIGRVLAEELASSPIHLNIGNRSAEFSVDEVYSKKYEPVITDAPKHYLLSNYMPLTDKNFSSFKSIIALTDKICFIEKIIVGNILSFLKGVDCFIDEELHVAITDIVRKEDSVYKGVAFRTYDIRFVSNIELPDNIGLGKSSSVGHGVLKRQ